ncbi:MAG: thioesterase family protein [Methanocellales archaeon]
MKTSKTELIVRAADVDQWRVVYFANYFRFFGVAIEDFFRSLQPEEALRIVREQKLNFPAVEAHCEYKSPARLWDVLELVVSVGEVRDKSIKFEITINRKGDGKLIAKGYLTVVTVDENWKPISIPKELLKILSMHSNV